MITITNKELGEEIRYIILEFVNKAGGQTKYVEELCDILDERLALLDTLQAAKAVAQGKADYATYDEVFKDDQQMTLEEVIANLEDEDN